MNDTRTSRCNSTDQLAIHVDGVPLDGTAKDAGCSGDVHIFTTTTTLSEPVTYSWHLDSIHNPILSNKPSYGYTFDDETHYLIVLAKNTRCGIQKVIEVKGRECEDCVTLCTSQIAYFPAGELQWLIEENGKKHKIPGAITTECKSYSKTNGIAGNAIRRIVRMASECNSIANAQVFYNKSTPNCLTLNITNSSIRFTKIQIGGIKYNITGC